MLVDREGEPLSLLDISRAVTRRMLRGNTASLLELLDPTPAPGGLARLAALSSRR